MKTILLALLLCSSVLAEEAKTLPPLPSSVTLKNGYVLKNVSVVRWDKDAVVLKHSAGVDPVRFDGMTPEVKAVFLANAEVGLAQKQADQVLNNRISAAITRHALIVGMTPEQAIQSWGKPDEINASPGREQWIYNRESIENTVYVYFNNGKLSSWQAKK